MFWRDDVDPGHEPHKVMIDKGFFEDTTRDERQVPYKTYYPVNHGLTDLPVIIWSHGLGGGRDGASFLGRFIASHGYVVMNIQHKGTDTSLWEGKPGHPWDVIRATHISRKATLNRFRDVPFVLDQLHDYAYEKPEIGDHMNLSCLGMSGHSFGAITTQIMAGQKLGRGKRLYSMKEKRFKAGIAYSPSPTYNHDQDHKDIYGGISIPMLYMTGTDDSSPVTGKDYTYRLTIFDNASADGQHLVILNDGDHMVFNGSRGKLADNPKRHIHEDIIKVSSLAFWDAYLKEDGEAFSWMKDGGMAAWLGDEGEYKNTL